MVGAGAVVVTSRSGDDDSANQTEAQAAPIRAVEAQQRDLAETEEVNGTVSFGDPQRFASSADGTVTRIGDVDDPVDRGDVLFEINERPTVVMWGDTPIYRTLEKGVDSGRDVEVLEENLVAMGYDFAGEVAVDQTFDQATADAVIAWRTDIGLDADGVVEPSMVLVLDGPAVIDAVDASVGTAVRAGEPVVALRITNDVRSVRARDAGRLTLVPSIGDSFSTGDVAYEIDTVAVPVVVGVEPLDRELVLGVSDGPDVEQLEAALAELGYDADGDLEVDETFDDATQQAVKEWEDDQEITIDGVVQIGQYAVVAPGAEVVDVDLERGDDVTAGTVVFVAGTTQRRLDATIDSDLDSLIAIGDAVEVEYSDGLVVGGTVTDIGTSQPDPASPDGEEVTPFEVSIDEVPPELDDRSSIAVTVRIVQEVAEGATVVPSEALVSLGDGAYAVEVVQGQSTAFVAVEPGLFADGFVAVTGIDPGTAVVIPS